MTKQEKNFVRMVTITIVCLFLLIIAGGVVRSTGSGMGCPDWPKCFDCWVPPTSVSDLPANYKEVYAERGYANTDFNVYKTWTEYLNRLLGAVLGLFFIGCVYFGFKIKSTHPKAFNYTLLALVLVLFQGWLGGKVVATNLKPIMVTVHMLLAMVILALMFYIKSMLSKERYEYSPSLKYSILGLMGLMLVQIALGTQVREHIDEISVILGEKNRATWIDYVGPLLDFHRDFAILVTILCVWVGYMIIKTHDYSFFSYNKGTLLIRLITLQIISGVLLNYCDMPSVAQCLHLVFATFTFGLLCSIIFEVEFKR